MTLAEAKTALCVKLNISYTDIANNELITDSELTEVLNMSSRRAWDYHAWPQKEKTYSTTSLGVDGYNDYPTDYEDESIERLTVEGVIYKKLNFQDYTDYLATYPDGTNKVWCELGRLYFVNPNTYTTGDEINITGKTRFTALSSTSDPLPFSISSSENNESSGNYAIVTLAYAELLNSEKYKDQKRGLLEEQRAFSMLDRIWKQIAQRRAYEQSTRPILSVPDYFGKSGSNEQSF